MTTPRYCLAVFLLLLLNSHSISAVEIELTEKMKISGNAGSVVLSPYQLSALNNNSSSGAEYTLYAIDYDELKLQIKTYQQIYVTGQILHGYLMIKMKPKFVK